MNSPIDQRHDNPPEYPRLGDKVICIQDMHTTKIGDTGIYDFGEDYVPGLDAGRFSVTLDNPRSRQLATNHWTYHELCQYWRKV